MSITNAYGNTTIPGYNVVAITADLALAKASGHTQEMSPIIHYVTEKASVSAFPFPLYNFDDGIVYVDARPFSTLDRDGSLKIRNVIEHQLRLDLANLEYIWARNEAVNNERMLQQFGYHTEVFSKWIAAAISHTFALTPYQNNQVMACAGLFAIGNFVTDPKDDLNLMRTQELLSKRLHIPFPVFETVTGNTDFYFPGNLQQFIELVKSVGIGPRVNDLSVTSLIQMLGGSFWGVSYDKPLLALSLEYPPAFMVMIKTCIDNTMYKKCRIGQVVDRSKAGSAHQTFSTAYNYLIAHNTPALK